MGTANFFTKAGFRLANYSLRNLLFLYYGFMQFIFVHAIGLSFRANNSSNGKPALKKLLNLQIDSEKDAL